MMKKMYVFVAVGVAMFLFSFASIDARPKDVREIMAPSDGGGGSGSTSTIKCRDEVVDTTRAHPEAVWFSLDDLTNPDELSDFNITSFNYYHHDVGVATQHDDDYQNAFNTKGVCSPVSEALSLKYLGFAGNATTKELALELGRNMETKPTGTSGANHVFGTKKYLLEQGLSENQFEIKYYVSSDTYASTTYPMQKEMQINGATTTVTMQVIRRTAYETMDFIAYEFNNALHASSGKDVTVAFRTPGGTRHAMTMYAMGNVISGTGRRAVAFSDSSAPGGRYIGGYMNESGEWEIRVNDYSTNPATERTEIWTVDSVFVVDAQPNP